jgi:Histidine kinase
MNPPDPTSHSTGQPSRWKRLSAAGVRGFHVYATWLVGISWKRFAFLSVMLLICAAVLSEIPPFSWTISETVTEVERATSLPSPPAPPAAPVPPAKPSAGAASAAKPFVIVEKEDASGEKKTVEISIGKDGVRVLSKPSPSQAAKQAAEQAASAASAAEQAVESLAAAAASIKITLPPGADAESVREAIEEASKDIREAIEDAKKDADDARKEAEAAREEAQEAARDAASALAGKPRTRVSKVKLGDALPQLAMLWVLGSIIIKATYKARIQAEVKAAQATEVAESESLKRQVVEARMAAMQAQVEPHFLFNTLASIDHLIETDPARASVMQKNLIALLRASMPTMREADTNLGRELAVIKPYLEILKVRMEERLTTEIAVPEGLLSADFPPMMLQSLVENAIKHGLEPKPEGGLLRVAAEIVHGKLVVSVADTGLGFGRAATAGTGVGLANIRERLQLLYGARATLAITENQPSGTVVGISLPYTSRMHEPKAA